MAKTDVMRLQLMLYVVPRSRNRKGKERRYANMLLFITLVLDDVSWEAHTINLVNEF
jgi:hypothetical protein